jgi:hypothetical protein
MKKIGDGLSVPMGTLCHGDGSSRGRFVQGTDRPRDGSSRGGIVQGTDRPGHGLSRGRFVRGRIVWGLIMRGHSSDIIRGKGKAYLFIAQIGRFIKRMWRWEQCFVCSCWKMYSQHMSTQCTRGGRFLDFLDFQPAATGV